MLAAALSAIGFAAAIWAGASLAARTGYGVPVSALDPVYADKCTACHMAYHPSRMGRENWSLLMENLANHYGEEANLDSETTLALTRWLVENSAETVDTEPSRVLAASNPAAAFTLTGTPYWKRRYEVIDAAVFKVKPIYSLSNCAACHTDAESGRKYPPNITIPKEPTQ